jgi:CARDB
MKRFAAIASVLALAALSSLAAAAPFAGTSAVPPRSHLRSFLCQRAVEPGGRTISVTAVMRPVPGTLRMAVRFDLLSRSHTGGAFIAVRSGDLGTWLSPIDQPTLGQRPGDVWVVSHPVAALPAPATYRYRVVFRWTGAKGRVLTTRTLVTANCFEPDLRPDLSVASIAVEPILGKPNLDSYAVLLKNGGATAAGQFTVEFAVPGRIPVDRTVRHLAAHSTQTETFQGPLCTAASDPTVIVDPAHRILDVNPNNNTLPATCPAS